MNNTIFYLHRPQSGISIAATELAGSIDFAMSLANTGITKNKKYRPNRKDHFCRKTGRKILQDRLKYLEGTSEHDFGCSFNAKMSAKDFMRILRSRIDDVIPEPFDREYYDADTIVSDLKELASSICKGEVQYQVRDEANYENFN